MAYAAALKTQPPPLKKEEIHYLLAHFSSRFSNEDLISAVKRSSGIIPLGIRPHPRGCLLAFSSLLSLETALAKPVQVGKTAVPLTPFPEIATPAAERGKRWRISGLEFWISAADIKEALIAAGTTPTEVKLETVKNFPTTRTPFATFWTKDEKTPTLKEIKGKKIIIFDPSPKKKANAPATAPQATASKETAQPAPDAAKDPEAAEDPENTDSPLESASITPPAQPEPTTPSTPDSQPSAMDVDSRKEEGTQDTARQREAEQLMKWDREKLTRVIPITPHQFKTLNAQRSKIALATFGPTKEVIRSLRFAAFPPRMVVDFEKEEHLEKFEATPLFFAGDKNQPLKTRPPKEKEIEEVINQYIQRSLRRS